MRLQAEGPPDPRDRRLTESRGFGHRPGAPMGRIHGSRFQGFGDHVFDMCIGDPGLASEARLEARLPGLPEFARAAALRPSQFSPAEQLEAVAAVNDAVAVIEEVVADKGYHSRTTVHDLETLEIRTYISEPDRGPQSWIDQEAERDAVYANRRRIRGARGKRLLRRRGELLERPCAHLYETGGLRRAHVRGPEDVLKRLLVHASAFHLGLWMRTLFGIGTPRALQGRLAALATLLSTLWSR